MSACKHKYIQYLGEQETPVKDIFLKLYNCLDCHSTIAFTPNTSPETDAVPAK